MRAPAPYAVAAPGAALAARSEWVAADASRLRLLMSAPENGRIAGGIEVALEPGWHTYWRSPGETGVPPAFDFSGSENVADLELSYPVPERYDDGASVSLVYRDQVVFPLVVTPLRPGRPVVLRLEASFGVCSEICIPTRAAAELTLPTAPQPDPLASALLARFLPLVPASPEPGRFDIEQVTHDEEALLIDVRLPKSSSFDLFAEPPEGWYLGQPRFVSRTGDMARYRLSLAGRPRGVEADGQTFRFVAVAGGAAIEKTVRIR
jgi:DsbC/DsbD-like thiol-disulfide interchange protein